MKYNIKRINYDGKESPYGDWWQYNEKCDKCGAKIRECSIMTSERPNTEESDFCVKCVLGLIKDNVSYAEAHGKYKPPMTPSL